MKATELRIGNLVNYDTAEGDVLPNVIDWQDLKWLSEDEQSFNLVHNPIPLTEEWLLKFGFIETKDNDNVYGFKLKNFWFINQYQFRLSNFIDTEGMIIDNKIQYIHQLQNLFYCLCGEELTLTK